MSSEKHEIVRSAITKLFINFQCPICFEEFQQTSTTSCGHRFCEDCLKQTIQLNKKCPNCNKPLQDGEYIRDVVFDSLIDEMKRLRDEGINQAVDKLINDVRKETNEVFDLQSPLHIVLKDYMAKGLRIHEKYLDEIKRNLNNQIKLVDEKLEKDLQAVQNSGQGDVKAKIEELKKNAQHDITNLKNEFDQKVKSLATRYSSYLDQTGITPLSMPVSLRLRVVPFKGGHKKNYSNFETLELKSHQDIQFVINHLVKRINKIGDEIVDIPADLLVLNLGPFSRYSDEECMKICEDYIRRGTLPEYIDVLRSASRKNCFPIQEYFIKPDSEIIFYGNLRFVSDLPKRCFRYTFDKANPKPVDYFKCNDCQSIQWICKSCKETCHKAHSIVSFSLKHQPTWACCNCQKTDCCQLTE